MGVFYQRRETGADPVKAAIEEALRVDPANLDVADEAAKRAAKAKEDAKTGEAKLNTGRLLAAIAIAAILVIGAIVLAMMADTQAIAEAGKEAANSAYESPDLAIKSTAEWLRTLGAAWSAGLVGVLLGEKAGASE